MNQPQIIPPVKLIAFDADDTLWDCQTHFDEVEAQYCHLLAPYGSAEEVSAALFATESKNVPLTGYGSKAFTLSLIENAIAMSDGKVSGTTVRQILQLGYSLLQLDATPLPGVEATLQSLQASGRYRMVVFTKGELLDQENKMRRSGLLPYFNDVVTVADKTPEAYRKLCRQNGCQLSELLMVGNSFRSDIEPVLQLGGYAVHIPFHAMWQHEVVKTYTHPHLTTLQSFSELSFLNS